MPIELGETKAAQLAALLRRQIDTGELVPGSLVPSQNALAREHHLSPTTVREALSALALEGLLDRSQGRATRVATRHRRLRETAAVVFANLADPFYAELIDAIQQAAAGSELRLLLSLHRAVSTAMQDELHRLRDEAVGAALVGPMHNERWTQSVLGAQTGSTGVVLFGPREPVPFHCVTVDRALGVERAVRHLHLLGHRRMVLLSSESTRGPWSRLRGLERARESLGLSAAECHQLPGGVGQDLTSAAAAAAAALDQPHRPTALIASSDLTALAVLRVAAQRGLRVPEDLSVVGFAASSAGTQAAVPLTSVSYRTPELGHECVRLLRHLLGRGRVATPDTVVVDPELIVRESTAPPTT